MAFEVRTFGKWILAGEHTVLRGGTALAFPIQTRFFDLKYTNEAVDSNSTSPYTISISEKSTVPAAVFERTLLRGLELVNRTVNDVKGAFLLGGNIPLSSGLGGSASICAAIAKLFVHFNFLTSDKSFSFCRDLEDMYHGKSSGLDVATVLAGHGISFKRENGFTNLNLKWQPNWYLLHSGVHSQTKDDVAKVNALWGNDAKTAQEIDDRMKKSVAMATTALQQEENEQSLSLLVEAQKLAASCFASWNLIPEPMEMRIQELYNHGALAVKPTGSGGGGFILSLWQPGVTPKTPFDLLSVYA